MPELSGLTVARELRRLRDAQQLPLVMLSSLGVRPQDDDVIDEFAAFLMKPIKASQLYDTLTKAVGGIVPDVRVARDEPISAASELQILLAEDNELNQRLALLLLEKLGYRAAVVGNGAAEVSSAAHGQRAAFGQRASAVENGDRLRRGKADRAVVASGGKEVRKAPK